MSYFFDIDVVTVRTIHMEEKNRPKEKTWKGAGEVDNI